MSEESFILIFYVNDGLVALDITFFQNYDSFIALSSVFQYLKKNNQRPSDA